MSALRKTALVVMLVSIASAIVSAVYALDQVGQSNQQVFLPVAWSTASWAIMLGAWLVYEMVDW